MRCPASRGATCVVKQTLGNWTLAGVITLQDGDPLTVTGSNGNNVLGIAGDFAELSGTCRPGQYVNRGSIESNINHYINTSCFTGNYPVVGADGVATGFGNSGVGDPARAWPAQCRCRALQGFWVEVAQGRRRTSSSVRKHLISSILRNFPIPTRVNRTAPSDRSKAPAWHLVSFSLH